MSSGDVGEGMDEEEDGEMERVDHVAVSDPTAADVDDALESIAPCVMVTSVAAASLIAVLDACCVTVVDVAPLSIWCDDMTTVGADTDACDVTECAAG